MSLTPRNIEEQKFGKSLRGYDKAEVEIFLKRVADEFARIIEENEKLQSALDEKKTELERCKKIEEDLQKTLLDAHETRRELIEEAKLKADEIVKSAEKQAKEIMESAENFASKQQDALAELTEAKRRALAELKAIIATQEKLLDDFSESGINSEQEEIAGTLDFQEEESTAEVQATENINLEENQNFENKEITDDNERDIEAN